MGKPEKIRILGLADVELAMRHLRTAEGILIEFEKLIRWRITPLGRRALFTDADRADALAGQFEGYVNACANVPGSRAWGRMVREGKREQPHLDEFLDATKNTTGRMHNLHLKPVLRDRKERLRELREYYTTHRASLMRKQNFVLHDAIAHELTN